MKCLRCNNEDERFFGYDQGIYYCRKCISFSRVNANTKIRPCTLSKRKIEADIHLEYELTEYQKFVSNRVLEVLKNNKDVFLYACTGAGKTEITFESIQYYLSLSKKVGFAISRRQVVIEIAKRLRIAFPDCKVVAVAQGFIEDTDGDIIVCTMHQLYRYPYGFDLLIMDEVDAFPYVGNDVLNAIASLSCVGQKLYLSATPDEYSLSEIKKGTMEMVQLFKRPHGYPLPIPNKIVCPYSIQILVCLFLCYRFKKQNKQVLIFVPRKEDTVLLHYLFSLFVSNSYIHSQIENKDQIMEQFYNKKWNCLFTTTLLERGITIPDVQVIVLEAQHSVFSCASLIQIFGRAGRSFKNPKGECFCLCQRVSPSIKECINQLKMMNDTA